MASRCGVFDRSSERIGGGVTGNGELSKRREDGRKPRLTTPEIADTATSPWLTPRKDGSFRGHGKEAGFQGLRGGRYWT